MPDNGETAFQIVFRYAGLIQARETELGAYFGDGPTSEQLTALVDALKTIADAETALPATLWAAFRIAVDTEMSWLFPERDTLAEPMTEALRTIQTFTGIAVEGALPETKSELEKYASLSIVANAARRKQLADDDKIIWRLWFARVLYRVRRFLSGHD